jgi:hypothetical protein
MRKDFKTGDFVRKALPEDLEQFADVVASAGRPPTARELAEHWAERAASEQRLADLKRKPRRKPAAR